MNPMLLVALAWGITQGPALPKAPALPPINPGQARVAGTLPGLDSPATCIAANEATGMIAIGTELGRLHSWPRANWMGSKKAESSPDQFSAHEGSVIALAVGDGYLVTIGADRKLKVWGEDHAKPTHGIDMPAMPRSLAVSGKSNHVAVGNDANGIQIFDRMSGARTKDLTGHADWVSALAFNAAGNQLASGSLDGRLFIWDVAAGSKREIHLTPPAAAKGPMTALPPVTVVAFKPDGKGIAVGSGSGQIHLVGLGDGKILRTLTGHTTPVTGLSFHPASALLVSTSKERGVRFWNTDNGQPFANLEVHGGWVTGVVALELGTRFATASIDGTARIWDLTPKK